MVGSNSPTASYPNTSTSFPGLHQAFPCSFSHPWPHPFLRNNTAGCILNQNSVFSGSVYMEAPGFFLKSEARTLLVMFTPSFVSAGPLKALVFKFMSSGKINPLFSSSPGSSSLSQTVSPPSPTPLCVFTSLQAQHGWCFKSFWILVSPQQ